MKKIALLLAAFGLAGSALAATIHDGQTGVFSERATIDRIKAIGSVCVEGKECEGVAAAAAPAAAAAGGGSARSGEDIYKSNCSACHSTGAAGAPKHGDKGDWGPRIAKGKETLYKHALEGFNAMPPKGMCSTCSDDEIKATVDYIIK